ncbi:MAG TPA: hypothetical protein VGK14_04870 [Novimethylophilus sp.]|jgi:hypothetical protein|uniref:hypothetical protein n=1 Tax=Novimethylophilus sp. TaxID=2137426 RepID=UPI002F41C17C
MKLGKFVLTLLMLLGLCIASFAARSAPAGRVLVYISPQEYAHEIKLWHFYYNYWFSQGRAIEPVALDALQPMFADIAMCDGNKAADVVVWIKPHMFYNPRMTVYYGTVVADVYSGSGKPVATYKADVQHNGYLDVLPAAQINATYRAAMQEIVRQMQADNAMQALVSQGLPASETAMPCSMVTILHPNN